MGKCYCTRCGKQYSNVLACSRVSMRHSCSSANVVIEIFHNVQEFD